MSQDDRAAPLAESYQGESSAVKTSVVSPTSSVNNSFTSSPQGNPSNADSGLESDPLSDFRDQETSAPPLAPTASYGIQQNQNLTQIPPVSLTQNTANLAPVSTQTRSLAALPMTRRPSFGLGFLSSLSNTIRGTGHTNSPTSSAEPHTHQFMSNSPTLANINSHTGNEPSVDSTLVGNLVSRPRNATASNLSVEPPLMSRETTTVETSDITCIAENEQTGSTTEKEVEDNGKDKDGLFSVRLTPIIDHSASNTGLYFSPIIRRIEPKKPISIGRYTEKHKSAAHAPQGSSSRVVFKSKVVSRTHALFQCNEEGLWFLKDCKSSSGTFLNNIRLSQASQELTLWPLMDGDVVQLGLDYRGGTEEVYRCVKMRCEFNRSWQRKVNRFNLDIHKRMKNLGIEATNANGEEFSECAICLLKLEPCQALFISPCSHSWHYKCIRPIIIKRYPQFYCPNCRSICDLETDIEDEDDV